MTKCCETCQCKNLFDGLDMPTPPSLLDKHTKHPTLSDREWRKKLKQQNAEISERRPGGSLNRIVGLPSKITENPIKTHEK